MNKNVAWKDLTPYFLIFLAVYFIFNPEVMLVNNIRIWNCTQITDE